MVRGLTISAIAGVIALATMLPGCGEPNDGNDRDVDAEAMTEAGRADPETHHTDGHVAYEVSGMKKTASGAT